LIKAKGMAYLLSMYLPWPNQCVLGTRDIYSYCLIPLFSRNLKITNRNPFFGSGLSRQFYWFKLNTLNHCGGNGSHTNTTRTEKAMALFFPFLKVILWFTSYWLPPNLSSSSNETDYL
jgi:hypothetical protein